ncbi:MAG: hypothetical protein PHE06_12290 [Lachnospiraceae bacterium]|nr:hypothetical protein [Lachnospiraceae bacterium]MDD3796718.1 hypothetical protein [Lachnospiraceae bacterium]
MFDIFFELMSNDTVFKIGMYFTGILSILIIVMFALKRNRDERGWKIFGKASVAAFAWLILIINVIAKITMSSDLAENIGYLQFANTFQWVYNTTIIVEMIAVFIISRRE